MDDNAPSDFKFSKKRFEFSPAPATLNPHSELIINLL